jgi:hypothetical protein
MNERNYVSEGIIFRENEGVSNLVAEISELIMKWKEEQENE